MCRKHVQCRGGSRKEGRGLLGAAFCMEVSAVRGWVVLVGCDVLYCNGVMMIHLVEEEEDEKDEKAG